SYNRYGVIWLAMIPPWSDRGKRTTRRPRRLGKTLRARYWVGLAPVIRRKPLPGRGTVREWPAVRDTGPKRRFEQIKTGLPVARLGEPLDERVARSKVMTSTTLDPGPPADAAARGSPR